jgi:tetratricopeptide (TPR) repeat protein
MNFGTVQVDDFEGCVKFAADPARKHVPSAENTSPPRQLLRQSVALWGALVCGPLGAALGLLPTLWSQAQATKTADLPSTAPPQSINHTPSRSSESTIPADESSLTPTNDQTGEQLHQFSSLVQSADADLKDGRIIQALRRYRSASEVMRPTPQVLLRLALAAEASGDDPLAWESFLKASELDAEGMIGRVAQLGLARIASRLGNINHAIHCLNRLLLQQPAGEDPAILEEAVHLLAQLRCGGVSNDRADWKELNRLALPALKLSPDRWSQLAEGGSVEPPTHNPDQPPRLERQPCVTVLSESNDKNPDQTWIAARIPEQEVLLLIEAVCLRAGWTLKLESTARPSLEGRVAGLDFERLPVGFMLDALLHETHLDWAFQGGTIEIRLDAENIKNRDRQTRATRVALTLAPKHRWSGATLLALAKVAMSSGDTAGATRWLEQALRVYPRSELSAVTYFNLGKARLAMNQIKAAQVAFQRAVDSGHGQPCQAPAYLYLGRLQLEQGELKAAVTSLSRCLAIGPNWPEAALLLAVAQLRAEHPVNANTVLMDHRALFVEPHDRDTAAFLSACARYRHAATGPSKDLEARELVLALGPVTQVPSFSTALPLLVADVSRELGLETAAIEIARGILAVDYDHACRDQAGLMVCELAEDGEDAEAIHVEVGAELWRLRAWLRHGMQGADRRNPQLVVSRCQRLLASEELPLSERQACLRTLGSAYETLGKHLEAVYCFAGIPPERFTEAGEAVR